MASTCNSFFMGRVALMNRSHSPCSAPWEREKHAHGIEGHKNTVVGAVTVAADLGDDADHLEIHVIEQDGAAHGRLSRKHVLEQFPSHDSHAPMLGVVFVIEPASGIGGQGTNLVVLQRAAPKTWPLVEPKSLTARISSRSSTGETARKSGLVANSEIIGIGKVVRLPRLITARQRRGYGPERQTLCPDLVRRDSCSGHCGSLLLDLPEGGREPTPHAIPNMVRKERSLCAHSVDSDCRSM